MTKAAAQSIKILGALLILLHMLYPQPSFASDSKLEEAALNAGCVPSRVEEISNTNAIVSWVIYCLGKPEKSIVVTCQQSACRAETAQGIEHGGKLR